MPAMTSYFGMRTRESESKPEPERARARNRADESLASRYEKHARSRKRADESLACRNEEHARSRNRADESLASRDEERARSRKRAEGSGNSSSYRHGHKSPSSSHGRSSSSRRSVASSRNDTSSKRSTSSSRASVSSSRQRAPRSASPSRRSAPRSPTANKKSLTHKTNSKTDSKAEPLLGVMVVDTHRKDKRGKARMLEEEEDKNLEVIESGDSDVPSSYDDQSNVGQQDFVYSVLKVRPMTNPEPMVNGLLVQLKFSSEVCPWPLSFSIVLAALGTAVTSILPHFFVSGFDIANVIISSIIFFASVFIIFLEGRFSWISNPLGCRASVRDGIVRHVNVFKLVWGRGVLYLIVGLLSISQMIIMTYISGGIMALCGFISLVVGGSASIRLNKLRNCLTDDEYLLALFSSYDSDQNGYLSPSDFAKFIMAIGLDFDDSYTLRAFKAIDKNFDLKIRFVDFHKWWSQCSVEGNEVANLKKHAQKQ